MGYVVKKLGTFLGKEDNASDVLIAINCYDGAQCIVFTIHVLSNYDLY